MKIAIDLGNKFVKAQTDTGERVFFRPVIATAPARRQVFSVSSKKASSDLVESESIQVSIGSGKNARSYYVGKLAERRGELPERVFGKEKYTTASAQRLIWAALALLVKGNEPVDLVLDFPYGQFAAVKDHFADKLRGKTETVAIHGQAGQPITIRSVAEYPQSLVAAYALMPEYQEVFAEDDGGYIAIVDIGGGTTDVAVFEMIHGDFVIDEDISGTLQHGTHDLTQVIRRRMESETGDLIDADLADRIVEKGRAFYGDRVWSFPDEVAYTAANLAAVLKSQINDLFGIRKNRIRAMFWIGGGASLLEKNLQGFHFQDIFPKNAQWKNVEGCLLVETALAPIESGKPENLLDNPVVEPPSSHNTNTSTSQQNHRDSAAVPADRDKQRADHRGTDQPLRQSQQHKPRNSVNTVASTAPNNHDQNGSPNIPKRFQEGAPAW